MFRNSMIVLTTMLALAGPTTAATVDVYAFNFDFSINPQGQPIVDAVINVGDTIRWVRTQGGHTTTSVAGIPEVWNGELSSSNPTFQHTFTQPGTWWYYCIPHGFDNGNQTAGGMSGTITVLPVVTGACCLTGGTCSILSQSNCQAQGGTYQGNGTSCTPNPCPQPTGACCAASGGCSIVTQTSCTAAGGTWQGAGTTCSPNPCPQPTGACCLANGTCTPNVTQANCTSMGGTWQGAGVSCSPNPCAQPTGACCMDDGICSVVAQSSCATAGGIWQGTGTICSPNPCPQPTGACCMNDGTCSVVTAASCTLAGGTWQGAATTCSPNPCPPPTGACCLPNGSCIEVVQGACAAQNGTWQGANTMCAMVSCPVVLTPYLDPLPLPAVAQPTTGVPGGAADYNIAMREVFQQLHSQLPPTRVWGYGGTYPGPTLEARRGLPITVTWTNDIRVFETQQLRPTHVLPVQTCMHGPDVWGEVPMTVVHLHGGLVSAQSDGYPEWAFPPGQSSPVYDYPNSQPAATIWYHDHALGITRLNVMMGLAGFFLIRDDVEDALNIPRGEFEIAMAIQDRSFNADGSLKYPEMMMDHFFGDTLLVNGKVWPYLNVKQGKYRFRIVDGSTSRSYRLSLSNGAMFWQIGTDNGLLPAPVAMTQLLLTPGERADVVVDFAAYAAGTEIILANDAPAPYPGNPGEGVIPNVMKFIVQGQAGDIDPLPASLVPVPPISQAMSVKQRTQELRVIADPHCKDNPHGMWTIDGLLWDDITEFPRLGATEIWAWKNRSSITHPMHMHLVSVQVLDRQEFDTVTGLPFGPLYPPAANEVGWKDTVQSPPGYITRVITRFEGFQGLYPYHCHIIDHEDHEMMRQFQVRMPCPADIAPAGNVDDEVNIDDLVRVITSWGATGAPGSVPADVTRNGIVDIDDLVQVITHWGACP